MLFDYGTFLASYEAVITEVSVFDAGFDVIADKTRLSLRYDTPYIRHLPSRLDVTSLTPDGARTEQFGPSLDDAFRIELDAFHAAVTNGAPVRTGLSGSMKDLRLIAEIALAMEASRLP